MDLSLAFLPQFSRKFVLQPIIEFRKGISPHSYSKVQCRGPLTLQVQYNLRLNGCFGGYANKFSYHKLIRVIKKWKILNNSADKFWPSRILTKLSCSSKRAHWSSWCSSSQVHKSQMISWKPVLYWHYIFDMGCYSIANVKRAVISPTVQSYSTMHHYATVSTYLLITVFWTV